MSMRRTIAAAAVTAILAGALARAGDPPPVQAVAQAKGGGLVYTPDARGDRVPDFSFAGYTGGGVDIPTPPARVIVTAKEGDQTARLQAAIDYVAGLAPDEHGFRGAVLLGNGRFDVEGALKIRASGVVLRGSGMGDGGTVLVATGQRRRPVVQLTGVNDRTVSSKAVAIANDYVPVGAVKLRLPPDHGLKVGDTVIVRRPCTKEWVHAMHMDRFGGDRHGGSWKPGSRDVQWERKVVAVDGPAITLDVPLTASLDKQFGGGTVAKYSWPGRLRNVGVENLRIDSAFDANKPKDEDHAWFGVTIDSAQDAWVRQVTFTHFVGDAVAVWDTSRRVTVEDCKSLAPVSEDAGERRQAFFTAGGQTLFQRCYSQGGRHDFAVGFCAPGPNAFVQCWSDHSLGNSGPIDSFATGVLYDNVRIDGNELNLWNRWYHQQQTGWAAADCLLWQCTAAVIHVDDPPGAANWAYGCWGEFSGDGEFASSRESIKPDSLYYAQLAARLGPGAMKQADILLNPGDPSSSPTPAQAAEQIAAAEHPGPRMDLWIDEAPQRHPISTDAAGAKDIDDLWKPAVATTQPAHHQVAITRGWLTRDGLAVVGGQRDITWWAGGVRPDDVAAARKKDPNITRFVPGRYGPGLTDDLDQLTDDLRARGDAALRHHYGLWYDTRDTDHERVRRENGDVWPPFYELPFLRSGTGVAWDGLSQYDLTRYNPWYWNRLKQFADVGDRKGVFLIAEHYFQHNIIEAGAHWASNPWRSANNINHTGFPEPPPYAGDKRIFMAKQFYDVTNPTRRAIHRAFIRKNLDNFADCPNIIHLTSAEFTGPLSFVQFWLDTIAEWEGETGKHPIIGLSATKDVQDAILADPKRAPIVSLIDINYWWYQPDGKAYAPPGGENLAPRQWARQIRSRPASADSVYRAVREYREKFPDKAVIYSADHADAYGWAALLAGGSMPSIRTPLPDDLRAALPSMTVDRDWVLSEKGKHYLVWTDDAQAHLDLSSATGPFAVTWIDPKSGKATRAPNVSGGAPVELKSPWSGPAVVWVSKE